MQQEEIRLSSSSRSVRNSKIPANSVPELNVLVIAPDQAVTKQFETFFSALPSISLTVVAAAKDGARQLYQDHFDVAVIDATLEVEVFVSAAQSAIKRQLAKTGGQGTDIYVLGFYSRTHPLKKKLGKDLAGALVMPLSREEVLKEIIKSRPITPTKTRPKEPTLAPPVKKVRKAPAPAITPTASKTGGASLIAKDTSGETKPSVDWDLGPSPASAKRQGAAWPVDLNAPAQVKAAPKSRPDISSVVEAHGIWLSSSGQQGERADLQGMDLFGQDLSGVDLSGAILRKTNFSDTVCTGARFHDADLRNTDFSGARLEEADMGVAKLRHAKFHLSQLNGATLRGADLAGANFDGARLNGTDLTAANLLETDFTNTDLSTCIGLDVGQLSRAIGSLQTRLPPGLSMDWGDGS